MRKALLGAATAAIVCVLPASAAANPQYWGGHMEDLPTANITYKVNSHGAVKDLRVLVKLKCRYSGGKPAANSRLSSGFNDPRATATGFEDQSKQPFGTGKGFIAQKVEGDVIGLAASGFFKSKLRYDDPRHGNRTRICHTGKQNWTAKPLRFSKWNHLRNRLYKPNARVAVVR
jgi:hypothetical protein